MNNDELPAPACELQQASSVSLHSIGGNHGGTCTSWRLERNRSWPQGRRRSSAKYYAPGDSTSLGRNPIDAQSGRVAPESSWPEGLLEIAQARDAKAPVPAALGLLALPPVVTCRVENGRLE